MGASITRSFSFLTSFGGAPGTRQPGASCGDIIQLTLQLQDGTNSLGQLSIPFRLGTPSHPLQQDFEAAPLPNLPPGWLTSSSPPAIPWSTVTNPPPNTPSAGGEDAIAVSGPQNVSAYIPDLPGQSVLTTPPFIITTPQAQLYFRQAFSTSNRLDGCILEIAIGSAGFQDILRAGGPILQGLYNTVLDDRNPLGPVPGWSGNSGGWIPVYVNLPAAAVGQPAQLRWHFAGAVGTPTGFWFIDSVQITEPVCLPPVSHPVILNPAVVRNLFTFVINTVTSRTYIIEYKLNLNDSAWQFLENLTGNGLPQTVSAPFNPSSQAYFRFRVE